jgi:hypothetical protein
MYVSVNTSPLAQRFAAMENQISASTGSGPIPVDAQAWQSMSGAYLAAMQKAGIAVGVQLAALNASDSTRLVTEAVLAGGLGLLAVVVSVFLLVWFGRKVTGDLTRLHGSVRAMAEERLPRVVERLRLGQDVDVLSESLAPGASSIQEISQVANSFATVQGAAVAAAVEQARLRKGVNQVFLNISMRNQSLLQRQLAMLDGMHGDGRGGLGPHVLRVVDPDAVVALYLGPDVPVVKCDARERDSVKKVLVSLLGMS